jgi:hypothetical protein
VGWFVVFEERDDSMSAVRMPAAGRIAATVCGVVGALALSAPALAARPHVFSTSFAKSCAAEPCTGEFLKKPVAVAVGEEAGEVYVLDEGEAGQHGRVVRFNTDGTIVKTGEVEFDGSGSHGEGTAAGGGGKGGEIPTGRFEEPNGIAVDNSCALRKLKEPKLPLAECEKEDPSNGDVYVADSGPGHLVIDKYTADGKYIGQLTGAGEAPFASGVLEGVAVDASGTVGVYREGPVVDRFTNTNPNVYVPPEILLEGVAGSTSVARPGFAIDGAGDFYGLLGVSNGVGLIPRIVKWNPAGSILDQQVGSEEASGVAVDQSTDTVFVDNLTSIGVFDPEGKALERLGQGELSSGTGLGADAGGESLYAADASGKVLLFGPGPATVPVIEGESFSGIGSDRASLEAEINPSSEEKPEEGQTEYFFEYGRCATLDPASCGTSAYEKKTPPGKLSPDFTVHPVSAQVTGLSPDATYHFRAVARNKHGDGAPGEELTFTTEGLGGEVVLPDGRGYELVSPPDKQGALIGPIEGTGVVQAAASGEGITYLAVSPTEAGPAGYTNRVQVLSRRSVAGWSTRDLAIAHSGATGLSLNAPEDEFFDRELSMDVLQPFGPFIPGLSEEATEATAYLHDLGESCGARCFRPLVTGKVGIANVPEGTHFGEDELCVPSSTQYAGIICGPQFVGASEDLSHVVLSSDSVALGSGAVPRELFEWAAGRLAPVSVLPGPAHEPTEATLGDNSLSTRGAVSSDGNRIFWESSDRDLYMRDMAREETLRVDESEGCGECTSGPGAVFQFASSDGSRVFFTDSQRLTEHSGAEAEKPDLYECEIVSVGESLTCKLSDLTPMHGGEGADVLGSVLGAAADGSAIFFVADGVQSEEGNGGGQLPVAGQPNLYVHRGGRTEFIATLSSEAVGVKLADETDWSGQLGKQPTRVSPNGRYVEFMSQARLTGYDNRDVATGRPAAEVYLYDEETRRLSCASCEPSGARPVGVEYKKLEPPEGLVGGPRGIWPSAGLVAANVPGWPTIGNGKSRYQSRYLNDEGRLFFDTVDALVPQDSNGTQDVYEYEPPGVGDCSTGSSTYSPRSGGCVALISSGSSAEESAFLDASESGDDVFFLTSAKLSPLDTDNARDVYDAHVCTGSSPCITFPDVQSPPCTNESSCKASPTPQPSIFGAPASATFAGPGNPVSTPSPPPVVIKKVGKKTVKCAKGRKLSHGKCVRVKVKRKTNRKGRK